ncbi:MAG: beta-galactosidase GalA [Chthoniobacterales bacterium]
MPLRLHLSLAVVLFCATAMNLTSAGAAPNNGADGKSPRVVQSLDRDWRFHLGAVPDATAPGYDDSGWRRVDVPHDYVVEGKFVENDPTEKKGGRPDWFWCHAFLPVQPAVYRKELSIPASNKGKTLWLEFDGVFNNSRYWLNGQEVYSQYSGYTRARFDITKAAKVGGKNTLVVELDPRYEGWWYEGGGIYRHARMVTLDPVHIAPDGVFVMPQVENPGDGVKADADVKINTDLANTSDAPSKATIQSEILDAKGKVLATKSVTQALAVGADAKVTQSIPLPGATLWSLENPHLYKLRSTVTVSGKIVDQVTTNFGVRHIRFDAKSGLFLNGKHVKLKGVNMHQDHAGVGVAVPDRLFTWRLERLKEMGCNSIRMSHNPVTSFLLDECDRMGILVMAENRNMGDLYVDQTPKDAPAVEHRELSALVLRDRNHPSIFCWSLCNEQWISGTPESGAMVRAMMKRVRELDPTRPITAALNGGFDTPQGIIGQIDLIGINYNPWAYDPVHARFPDIPIVASEIASEIGTRGIYATEHWEDYYGDRARGYASAYSITAGPAGQTVEKAWPPVATRDNIAGGFVWAGFDYKGEPRPFGWPVINCHYGFFDICGFPKDSYYYYKAWWTNQPVLHVFPHWNWPGKDGEEIAVWVHSNCDEVELFLNGKSLGKQTVQPLHHLEWKVKYQPGTLLARGFKGGKEVLTDKVETTGQPATLKLTTDRATIAADGADGADVAVLTVQVADAKGRMIPTAGDAIAFEITGPGKIIGVGNGDPSSHEPDQFVATKENPSPTWSRSLFNGLAQIIVQSTKDAGKIKLTATGKGLTPASVTLQTQP